MRYGDLIAGVGRIGQVLRRQHTMHKLGEFCTDYEYHATIELNFAPLYTGNVTMRVSPAVEHEERISGASTSIAEAKMGMPRPSVLPSAELSATIFRSE